MQFTEINGFADADSIAYVIAMEQRVKEYGK